MPVTFVRLIAAAAGALAGAAVARELAKPPAERGWHGHVAGVPYDLRPPTMDKLRRAVWDPDNPDLVVPHAFGVGWSINFARLAAAARSAAGETTPALPASPPAKEITASGDAE
jgi:hypothetical protein